MKYTVTPFELPNGIKCSVHIAVGEVLEQSSREVVKVSQGATRVMPTGANTGIVAIPGAIRSTTHQRQSLWLRGDGDAEDSYNIDPIAPLAARRGHSIALAYVSSEQTGDDIYLAGGRNIKTDRTRMADSNELFGLVVPRPMARYGSSWVLWLLLGACVAGFSWSYQRGTAAYRDVQHLRWVKDAARCDVESWRQEPDRTQTHRACVAHANSVEYQRELDQSRRRGADADEVSDSAGKTAVGSIVASFLVICCLGIRRGMYRSRVREQFGRAHSDAVASALAAQRQRDSAIGGEAIALNEEPRLNHVEAEAT